jgi:soluble lytic murein transglycosylase-like protein
MTTPVVHCYRHALRFARRVLRARPVQIGAVVFCAVVTVVPLAPAQVGIGMHRPVPVIAAVATSAVVPIPAAAGGPSEEREPVDTIAILMSALEDCPNALSPALRARIARIIRDESEEYGYDPLFITALMQVESGCSPTARGGDAVGLVQLLPSTAHDVARRVGVPWRGERTLIEPASNIAIGLRYLDELEDQLGDPYRAVAAYNMGPARVARMSSGRAQRTRYVRKVLTRYEALLEQGA